MEEYEDDECDKEDDGSNPGEEFAAEMARPVLVEGKRQALVDTDCTELR
jgi:hypothetical protein